MATTKDYLDQLTADKATLVQILNAKGVTASDSETFTELVPKVDTISGGGGATSGVSVIPLQSILNTITITTTIS